MSPSEAASLTLRAENLLISELLAGHVSAEDAVALLALYSTPTVDIAFQHVVRRQMEVLVDRIAADAPLMDSLRRWESLDMSRRFAALRALNEHVAGNYGISAPGLYAFREGPRRVGVVAGYNTDGDVYINVASGRLDDFEEVFSTLVHEVGHVYQRRLAAEFERGNVASSDPRRAASEAFALNYELYMRPEYGRDVYRNQPVEEHSRFSSEHAVGMLRRKLVPQATPR